MKDKILISTCALSLFFFILVLLTIRANPIDSSLNASILYIQNNLFTKVAKSIAFIFDVPSLTVMTLILFIAIWFKLDKKFAIFFPVVMLVDLLVIWILKELVQRARPLNAIMTENSFAFPSGHSAGAVVFFGLLAYLIFKKSDSTLIKNISATFSIFMTMLIGFTRLYLNVHWFSDVLGGFLAGTFILSGSILLWKKVDKRSLL